MPRSVMTLRGPAPVRPRRSRYPGPSPNPTEVTKATRSTNDRRGLPDPPINLGQDEAIVGRAPEPGRGNKAHPLHEGPQGLPDHPDDLGAGRGDLRGPPGAGQPHLRVV